MIETEPWPVDKNRRIKAGPFEILITCSKGAPAEHWDSLEKRIAHIPVMEAALTLALVRLDSAIDLFAKDHALDRFNWGASGLRSQDIRELNELPGQLRRAVVDITAAVLK